MAKVLSNMSVTFINQKKMKFDNIIEKSMANMFLLHKIIVYSGFRDYVCSAVHTKLVFVHNHMYYMQYPIIRNGHIRNTSEI